MERMRRRAGASYHAMHHTIRPGLHYARSAGRTLFLDLPRNRYFSLAPTAELDIERLERGETLALQSPLIRAGLVIACDRPFTPPVTPALPHESLLDGPLRPGPPLLASLLREYARARLSLALAPKRVLPREATRTWNLDAAADAQRLQQVAGAYQAASHLVGAHDQCLAWSLALMRLCRRRRDPVACVIGVSFRPFSAHCWVQGKDSLINDRYDKVRNFTPILVL